MVVGTKHDYIFLLGNEIVFLVSSVSGNRKRQCKRKIAFPEKRKRKGKLFLSQLCPEVRTSSISGLDPKIRDKQSEVPGNIAMFYLLIYLRYSNTIFENLHLKPNFCQCELILQIIRQNLRTVYEDGMKFLHHRKRKLNI